jgi:succinate-semialdehyde dehydrogenase/glutarate-semialdehyde dehydrogenase
LTDFSLLRHETLIDGHWTQADAGGDFPVTDPSSGAVITRVPAMGAVETRHAIAAAGDLPGDLAL